MPDLDDVQILFQTTVIGNTYCQVIFVLLFFNMYSATCEATWVFVCLVKSQ